MDQTAEKKGFVAVYPAGSGSQRDRLLTWNAGSCCAYAMEKNIDDVGYISKLIDYMIAEYHIDHRRVYATGHSNGAQMSYRLVCELAGKIAAVAPHGSQSVVQGCNPSRKVPIFHLHGTEDPCASYGGGECGGCFQDFLKSIGVPAERKTWSCESVEDSVKNWAIRYGCSPDPIVTRKMPMIYYSYQNCPDDVTVKLGAVNGSGHTWPGGRIVLESCDTQPDGRLCRKWKEAVGPIVSGVSINELMWEFFTNYSLPE
jgi:polyhydroxybutyrate depolymerase